MKFEVLKVIAIVSIGYVIRVLEQVSLTWTFNDLFPVFMLGHITIRRGGPMIGNAI